MDKITVSKKELLELIEAEVNKNLIKKQNIHPSGVFKTVAITSNELMELNVNLLKFNCNFNKGFDECLQNYHSTISISRNKDGENLNVYYSEIHEFLRKLSLAVFGLHRNDELTNLEKIEVAMVYSDFKNMFLSQYENRLKHLS